MLYTLFIGIPNQEHSAPSIGFISLELLIVTIFISYYFKLIAPIQLIDILFKVKPQGNLVTYIFKEYWCFITILSISRISTYKELSQFPITENGFRLDMARSRYLTVDVKKSVVSKGADGYIEDVRLTVRPKMVIHMKMKAFMSLMSKTCIPGRIQQRQYTLDLQII